MRASSKQQNAPRTSNTRALAPRPACMFMFLCYFFAQNRAARIVWLLFGVAGDVPDWCLRPRDTAALRD